MLLDKIDIEDFIFSINWELYREELYEKIYINAKESLKKRIRKFGPEYFSTDEYTKDEFLNPIKKINLKVIRNKIGSDWKYEQFRYIYSHLLNFTNTISKRVFKSRKFCNNLYFNYISQYLRTNDSFIRKNITDHVELKALIEPLFTGLYAYLKSKDFVKFYQKTFEACITDSRINISLMGDNNHAYKINEVLDEHEYNHYITNCNYIFNYSMCMVLYVCLLYLINNRTEFGFLNEICKDVEMSIVQKHSFAVNSLMSYKNALSHMEDFFIRSISDDDTHYTKTELFSIFGYPIIQVIANNKYIDHSIDDFFKDHDQNNMSISDIVLMLRESGLYEKTKNLVSEYKLKVANFHDYDLYKHFVELVPTDYIYESFFSLVYTFKPRHKEMNYEH